jgi:enolase
MGDKERITRLHAIEILDSRGRPTLQTTCELADGTRATVSVPSGASTGSAEAHELRDDDPTRHGGLGVRNAVANVNGEIERAIVLRRLEPDQMVIDQLLADLDGTPNKLRLGANALLSVSLAVARAEARRLGIPLYEHFANLIGREIGDPVLPRPTVNLFSGGKHAGGQIPIQDVLITARSAETADEAMAQICAVYQRAADICLGRYGMRALVADEGGLAPNFPSVDAALGDAVQAIQRAGLQPGVDVSLCIDIAASAFSAGGLYALEGNELTSGEMIEVIAGWCDSYPIISVEDGLAEDDWEGWPALNRRLGDHALVVGDDLLATNPARITRAIETNAANALLLKVNQIGTLTEAAEALRLARSAGWTVIVSARCGETEDDWLTDLAIGWGGDQLKVGSVTRSERLAKWNRLLTVADERGWRLAPWPGRT